MRGAQAQGLNAELSDMEREIEKGNRENRRKQVSPRAAGPGQGSPCPKSPGTIASLRFSACGSAFAGGGGGASDQMVTEDERAVVGVGPAAPEARVA
jgi:hypothetical protein